MNTEITDNTVKIAGRIFYDGECRLCVGGANRLRNLLGRCGFHLAPLRSRAAYSVCQPGTDLMREMRLVLADGTHLGGADAILEIARRLWWAWPLCAFSRLPLAMRGLRVGYRILAANRQCLNGACLITHCWKHLDWLPLAGLPGAAIACRAFVPDWVFMGTLASAMFFGCKWLTLRRACAGRPRPPRLTALAYLLLWPGMDAGAFLNRKTRRCPSAKAWLTTLAKAFAGGALLWIAVANRATINPPLAGWLGMFGVVLLLHFGLFDLLALFWETTGRDVTPVMRSPLLATSLADFWGNRWNTAFNALAHDFIFRPLARRVGITWATLGVFLTSGLIHDLVISLPARGGVGLPTAYFLTQGAGVLIERSRVGLALALTRGWKGRLFTIFVTATPAFWLFHPIFIHNVILPMLRAFGTSLNIP